MIAESNGATLPRDGAVFSGAYIVDADRVLAEGATKE
jgi:hypothetical protein